MITIDGKIIINYMLIPTNPQNDGITNGPLTEYENILPHEFDEGR